MRIYLVFFSNLIMIVEDGKFYFIKDEFFDVFKDYGLMLNKENGKDIIK